MSRFTVTKRLTVFAIAACVLTSCGTGSGKSSGNKDPNETPPASALNFEARNLQLAAHMVSGIPLTRRLLNQVIGEQLNDRSDAMPGDQLDLGGCRKGMKISPDPTSAEPATSEAWDVNYNCIDGAQTFATVGMTGQDQFRASYSEPLPKRGDSKPRSFPVSIEVRGTETFLANLDSSRFSPNDQVRVDRLLTFDSQAIKSDKDRVTYSVRLEIDDEFEFNVFKTYRLGTLKNEIEAVAVVDKKTRLVSSIAVKALNANGFGREWDKADVNGMSLENKRAFTLNDLSISVASPVELGPHECELPDKATFTLKRTGASPVTVTSAAGQLSIADVGDLKVRVCAPDRGWDPEYAQDLEDIFY